MNDQNVFLSIIQGIALLGLSPLLAGILKWWLTWWQKRRRSLMYIFQPYFDLYKLLRVPPVRSKMTSWVFGVTPMVVFIAYSLPLFALRVFTAPLLSLDLLTIVYLLGLARFTLSLAGLDSSAPFGGLGSSREMFFHILTEVVFFAILAALALIWQTLVLDRIVEQHAKILSLMSTKNIQEFVPSIGLLFLVPALWNLLVLEGGRIPADNPDTHLELTMANKAILLEFAGRDLALIEFAEMNKLTFLLALFANLFVFPFSTLSPLDGFLFLMRVSLVILFLGFRETRLPKLRLGRVPSLARASILFTLVAIAVTITARSF